VAGPPPPPPPPPPPKKPPPPPRGGRENDKADGCATWLGGFEITSWDEGVGQGLMQQAAVLSVAHKGKDGQLAALL
jgi:hypothetical protein